MFPGGPNPTQLQNAPPGSKNLPLVCIHDASGTTFGYFLLGDLRRDVWAIHNPRYWEEDEDKGVWDGGVGDMARCYVGLINEAGIRGPILLGGWSFGGYVAMEISHFMANDPIALFSIAGLIMLDSPYPHHGSNSNQRIRLELPDGKLKSLPKQVQISFARTLEYMVKWQMPVWGRQPAAKTIKFTSGGQRYNVSRDQALRLCLDGSRNVVTAESFDEQAMSPVTKFEPPPSVLLRCLQYTQDRKLCDPSGTVDQYREEPFLGWGSRRYTAFVKAIIDVDSNHFDLFDVSDSNKLDHVTQQLIEGLRILDDIANRER